ncbi:hypothetical protein ACQV2S_08395 [Facklamia sp. P13064]|uniref:hypothetical protein n=1 Tax=Facklamia sp. P13064 TaxID=3421953 RepID=UPI003D183B86
MFTVKEDSKMVGDILEVMPNLANDGMTMVVTHEIGFAREVSDRVIFEEEGYVIEDADTNLIFKHPAEARTKSSWIRCYNQLRLSLIIG